MAKYNFGVGDIFGLPADGSTPLRFGSVQGISVDIDGDTKELRGRGQFADDFARGAMKVSGKIAFGEINPDIYNVLYLGQTAATGQLKRTIDEAAAVPASPGPYTINAANRGSAGVNFRYDLGVRSATTGLPYQLVTASPTKGQYMVSALGVYTFAAGAADKAVLISYIYADSATGKTVTINQKNMGSKPVFQLIAANDYDSGSLILVLHKVMASKLSFPFKNDDYTINDMDFQAQVNAAGVLGLLSSSFDTEPVT